MNTLVTAIQADRRATTIHAGLGLLFPISMGCVLILMEMVTGNFDAARLIAGVLIAVLFHPMNKLAERLSGPWPEQFGFLTRLVPMFVCLAASAASVFLFLVKE
ncbi:hypothetical protein [Ruegeria arenilitoris]|uniref:hypothetical protein n=1 Tax=Ruegeria arenilitoris TaxID=1173585 RepID=UPI00147B9F2B|nr:hypothetical protein [Ruegeria arenilitoris]